MWIVMNLQAFKIEQKIMVTIRQMFLKLQNPRNRHLINEFS